MGIELFKKKAMIFGAKCKSEIKQDKDRKVSIGFGSSEVVTDLCEKVFNWSGEGRSQTGQVTSG